MPAASWCAPPTAPSRGGSSSGSAAALIRRWTWLYRYLFIALGLSMDAVAVSLASGCAAPARWTRRQALLLAFAFRPVPGADAGRRLAGRPGIQEGHRALRPLAGLRPAGVHRRQDDPRGAPRRRVPRARQRHGTARSCWAWPWPPASTPWPSGLSFSLLAVDIVFPVLLIGLVTFVLSLSAVYRRPALRGLAGGQGRGAGRADPDRHRPEDPVRAPAGGLSHERRDPAAAALRRTEDRPCAPSVTAITASISAARASR